MTNRLHEVPPPHQAKARLKQHRFEALVDGTQPLTPEVVWKGPSYSMASELLRRAELAEVRRAPNLADAITHAWERWYGGAT